MMNLLNLHTATFQEGANILTLSKGEDEAGEALDYSRFAHSELPDFLKLKMGKDQASIITFPSMNSRVRALPSVADAGVGFGGATRVVMDEFEYHRAAEQNFAEIYPAIEAGGQMVILSTADQTKMNTKFKELYFGAMEGKNRFHKIFFPRTVMPERTQKWYDSLDLTPSEKEARYPMTESDALKTSKARAFFDKAILTGMLEDHWKSLEHELSKKYGDFVKIYKLPQVGQKYCIFTDPSGGRDDPHCTIVINGKTKEEVAESHGYTPADTCAAIHDDLVRLYFNAYNSFDALGNAGGLFAAKLEELKTPNQAPRIDAEGKIDSSKHGMWLNSKRLRDKIIWGLEEEVRLHQIISHNRESIHEFMQFFIPEGEEPQSPKGGHDDYIYAWGGVCLLRKNMTFGEMEVSSWQYRG